jgi:hypothetical protein
MEKLSYLLYTASSVAQRSSISAQMPNDRRMSAISITKR